jgi:long-chain fatty acid transport protein
MNQKSILKFLPVIFISTAPVGNVLANGFALPDQDAFATARGEAFVATADNPSAIYYNPAGIAQLDGDNFRGGIYGICLGPTFKPPAGNANSGRTYHSSDQYAAVPQFFYSHTLENLPLSLGLGIYAPFGGSMDWGQNTGFRQVAISGSLKYITVAPTVAWKILPSLSVGAGAMVNYAHLKTSQGFQQTPSSFKDFFNFDGEGWSVGYNAGVLWKPIEQLSLGVNFRSSANVNLEGHTHYQNPLLTPSTYSPANMSMNFPCTIVPGISYRPTEKWNLEFDANYTDWSSFGNFDLYEKNPPPPTAQNKDIHVRFDWQGSWIYEFGVTRYFDNGWHASAGYAFNENSVPNKYYTPWAADLDRHFFSVGAGFNGKIFDFDVAFQFGYGPSHTVNNSNPSVQPSQNIVQHANGIYGFTSAALFVTAGVHF